MTVFPRAHQRSIYGMPKRIKRSVLRSLGFWSRRHYDVEIVFEQGRPTYKKITFKTRDQAIRVTESLRRFGPTRHLPAWRRRDDNAVWVDFVDGEPCNRIDDTLLQPIAECVGRLAGHESRQQSLDATPYWQRHLDNLAYLANQCVIDASLHRDLHQSALAARPATLRIGFDYGDPIGPNLLRRRCGAICAIDVKNLHRDTLVGEGLAKAADRWLTRERQRFVFAHLARVGLEDIEQAFGFIRIYERVARVRRKVERDLEIHRRVRARRARSRQLIAFLD